MAFIMALHSHVGLILIKSASKTIAEIAFELYAKHLIKTAKGYLAHQIDILCETGEDVSHDLYISRTKGHYTLEQVLHKLENAKSDRAKKIKQFMYSLHEEDDFVLIDTCDATFTVEN
jgi:hypothetical protein